MNMMNICCPRTHMEPVAASVFGTHMSNLWCQVQEPETVKSINTYFSMLKEEVLGPVFARFRYIVALAHLWCHLGGWEIKF